jgi:hypothetical protein
LPAPNTRHLSRDLGRADGEANASLNKSGVGNTGAALEN